MPSATARPCPTGVLLASRRAARRSRRTLDRKLHWRRGRQPSSATQTRLAPDAEASLERAIFFAVAFGCPHEADADEHERQRKQHDDNHDRDAAHPLSLPGLEHLRSFAIFRGRRPQRERAAAAPRRAVLRRRRQDTTVAPRWLESRDRSGKDEPRRSPALPHG